MSSTVPRDIARKLERRWSARAPQAGSFQAKTEQLKQSNTTLVEGVQSPTERLRPAAEADSAPPAPALPADED